MKRYLLIALAVLCAFSASAQKNKPLKYVEVSELNLIGKPFETPNPYHRIDTALYHPMTARESELLRFSAGLAVVFTTNSTRVAVKTDYILRGELSNMPAITTAGYTLYVRDNGRWRFAGTGVEKTDSEKPLVLASTMTAEPKECLIYLPLFSELQSVRIGVDNDAEIEAIENPFRRKILFWGSSFTHGSSSSNPSMSYPMQIERSTGLYVINMGMSGNSKLQPVFAEAIADVEADAYVFDAFSNPTAEEIEARLVPFIKIIRAKRPTTPLIFVQTIHRENANFSQAIASRENSKLAIARKLMPEVCKEFNDIYFIDVESLTGTDGASSADGTHPSDLGYFRWAQNLAAELLPILKSYGIE